MIFGEHQQKNIDLWELHTIICEELKIGFWKSLIIFAIGLITFGGIIGIINWENLFGRYLGLFIGIIGIFILVGLIHHIIGNRATKTWLEFLDFSLRFRREQLKRKDLNKNFRELLMSKKRPTTEQLENY